MQVKPIIPSTPELQNWEDMDTNTLPDPNQSLVSIILCREANLGRASRTIESAGVRRG